MKYALPASLALLAIALLIAVPLGPWLADWVADRAYAGLGYGYGYGPQANRWPVGSLALIAALAGCTLIGGGIVALVWAVATMTAPEPPDPKRDRRRKAQTLIDVVNRRRDLTPDEKEGFKDSALALADAVDPTSIRAAELVGEGDAVTAAKGLAQEAEEELQRWLRHAVNLATPFSDSASKEIDTRRTNHARIEELVEKLEACEDPKGRCTCPCKCGTACTCVAIAAKCDCQKDDSAACSKDAQEEPGETGKAHRTRLDLMWQ